MTAQPNQGAPPASINPLRDVVIVGGAISATSAATATAVAPTYAEGSVQPLSQDLSGQLRIAGTINASSSAKAKSSAPSYVDNTDNPFSQTLTGDLRVTAKQSGTWAVGVDQTTPGVTNAVDVTNFPVTADVNSGNKSNNTIRVTLATDQVQLTNALKVDGSAVTQPVSGTFYQATQPMSAASLPLPTGASTATNQTSSLAVVGAATAPTNMRAVGGVYNSTPLTLTNTQSSALQLDANGYLAVNIKAGAGSGGTASTFGSAFPATGTAIGALNSAGTNMAALNLDASGNLKTAISSSVAVTGTFWQATQPVSGTFWQTTQPVSIATAPVLVAGSAIIGKVGIDQTTPGTTNAVSAVQNGTWNVGHGKTIKTVSVNITADTDIIAAVASKRLKIIAYALFKTGTNANPILFKSNGVAGTEVARILLQSQASAVFGANLSIPAPSFLFATAAGEKLTIDVSDTDTLTGFITYFDDDAT